jgi:hypothetical protein
MVQSKNILSLVLLPSLALAGNTFHHRRHAHHQHQQRAVAVSTVVKTQEQIVATVTVTYGHIPSEAPKADAVPDIKADAMGDVNAEAAPQGWGQHKQGGGGHKPSSQPPAADPTTAVVSPSPVAPVVPSNPPVEQSSSSSSSSSIAAVPVPTPSGTAPAPSIPTGSPSGGNGAADAKWTPGKFIIQNNCAVNLYLTVTRDPACGKVDPQVTIKAGQPWTGDIETCGAAHPSYKVSKVSGSLAKIVQLEVGRQPTGDLWENISLINCVEEGSINGEGIEQCPGAPWYLGAKSTAANAGDCQQFQCQDATSCCQSSLGAYCDPISVANDYKQPVGGCKGETSELAMFASFC